jgi:hypothetical protein
VPNQDEFDVRHEIVSLLMEKVHRDPFPSSSMMDTIEELLTPDEVPAYAGVLMEKIRADEFPSLDLINRVKGLG